MIAERLLMQEAIVGSRLEFVEGGEEARDPYGPESFPAPLPPGEGAAE